MDAYTLEAAAAQRLRSRAQRRPRVAVLGQSSASFLLGLVLPLYLAVNGGGYERVLYGEVGVAIWWVAIAGVLCGVLPLGRLSRQGILTLGILLALALWSGVSALWSLSGGSSVEQMSQLSVYGGFLALGLLAVTARTRVHLMAGLLCAIAVVCVLALCSRLSPGLFAGSQLTGRFLSGSAQRLSWPINYWNGLAALVAMGVPLAVHFAARAKHLLARSAAAACIPMMLATSYLTFSRGGWLEMAVAVVVLLALGGGRLWTAASMALGAGGGAILIAATSERPAVMHNAANTAAARQGGALILMTILVCLGVAVLNGAISLIERERGGSHSALRRASRLREVRPGVWVGVALAAAVILFLAFGGPAELVRLWHRFEGRGIYMKPGESIAGRLTGLSGEGRWQMWLSCLAAFLSHPLGIGAGTFWIWWPSKGSIFGYVKNAHSLYFETLGELGLPGILLLAAFLTSGLWGALRGRALGRWRQRALGFNGSREIAAAIASSCVAFWVAAIYDWVWQLPALVSVLMLLVAAGLAREHRDGAGGAGVRRAEEEGVNEAWRGLARAGRGRRRLRGGERRRWGLTRAGRGRRRLRWRRPARMGSAAAWTAVGALSIAAIAWPLSEQLSMRESVSEARSGRLAAALSDAKTASAIEPFSAEAPLQQALVLEQDGSLGAASRLARTAIANARSDWQSWAVLARIEAERGRTGAALTAWRTAHALDRHDPLFKG